MAEDPWAAFSPSGGAKAPADAWAEFNPTSKAPGEDVTAGMALRGIPVLGAYIPQAEAAIRAAAQPLTGVGEPGATYSERYARNLPQRQADYARAEAESPWTSEALKVGGGAAALAPVGATAAGAKLLGAAGPMALRIPLGAASGAGISAADAAARGEDVGTAAKWGAGLGAALPVIGGAVGKIGQAGRSYLGGPTTAELGAASDAGYAALRGSNLEIKPQAVQSAINQIRLDQQIHPSLTPGVSGLLEKAATKGIMSPLTGKSAGASFDDIDTLRKQLGAVARNYNNPTEQQAARDAIRGIDDYLAKMPQADVLSGDAAQVSALAKETRANTAAEFRARAIDSLRTRAEDQAARANSGLNVENAYRQQLSAFIRPNNKGVSPAKKEGFTPEEIDRMRVAMRATSFQNMLRLIGNALGGGHGVMAGAGLVTSAVTGDPKYAAMVGAGYGMRRASNALMRNQGEMLGRMTAARSPLAQQMGVGGPGLPLNTGALQSGLLGLLPGMAEGGRPYGPTLVGEQGPELFVPDRPGTIVPGSPQRPFRPGEREQYYVDAINGPQGYPDFHWVNPAGVDAMLAHSPESKNVEDWRDYMGGFGAAAQRTARGVKPPGGRQEGAGTKFVEGGYGVPSLYKMLDEGAQRAVESAGSLQRGGSYDPAPVLQQALGAVGAPLVGPAQAGATLGAGAIRRAAIPQTAKQALFDYSRLRDVPDVPQVNLERYQPPRGVAERTQALADPANVARVNEVVKRGAEQGGIEWYNTEPLREAFISELGAKKGMPAYQQYLDLVASTSPRSNVGTNVRNAAYYYGLAQRGEPLPVPIAKGGALSIAEPLPSPYGHIAQGLHAQNAKNVLEAGGWPVLQNPKPASFAQNLAGNQMPVTVDTHNARLWGMTDTKGRPIDKPAKTEYDFMERMQQAEAAKLGMTPAQYQASAWIGGGEQTGLKSSADPFLKVVEDRIRLTAEKTGETPQQVLQRFIRGGNIPGGAGPLLGVGGVVGADALSRRD